MRRCGKCHTQAGPRALLQAELKPSVQRACRDELDGIAAAACIFDAYVEQFLVSELRAGDVVIMDNLRPHKVAAVREAIEACGAKVMYLPPYSPDLSPIEPMWAQVKEHLRSAKARTDQALISAIGDALRSVTPSDIEGYFRHCGYS